MVIDITDSLGEITGNWYENKNKKIVWLYK